MGRLFVWLALAALLALAPLHSAGEQDAQGAFFSLLFPQLAPRDAEHGWGFPWADAESFKAVML